MCFRPLPGSFLFHQSRGKIMELTIFVSVPCRGLFYFIKDFIDTGKDANSFRPLPGSFLFHRLIGNSLSNYISFRPLPGSFLFHQTPRLQPGSTSKFPSPAGVFFISSRMSQMQSQKYMKFPSPAGVFFISSLSMISRYI